MKVGMKIALALMGLVMVFSCQGPTPVNKPGKGTVELALSNEARTMLPDLNLEVSKYEVVFKKGSSVVNKTVSEGTSVSASLDAGTWTIQVDAYNKDTPAKKIGTGSGSVVIQSGKTTSATITVLPLVGAANLSLTVKWDGMNLSNPIVDAKLTPANGGIAVPLTFTRSGTTATCVKTGLPAGYYTLDLTLKDGTTIVGLLPTESVRLMADATTQGTINFSGNPETGTVNVTITIDLQLPMEIVISGVPSQVKLGQSVTATATASETGVTWSWYLDGVLLAGKTSATLTLSGDSLTEKTYRLDAFAQKGSKISSKAVVFTVVEEVLDPTVSAAPGTSTYTTDGLDVVLSASNPASGKYSVDGVNWIDFTHGQTVKVGVGLNDGQTVTLKLKNGTAEASYVYTRKVSAGLVIGFKKAGSTAPTIWLWEDLGRAIMSLEGKAWPGPGMEAYSEPDWWTWTIPAKYLPISKVLKFKFDQGAEISLSVADQTAGKTWYNGSSWQTAPVPVAKAPAITMTEGGFFPEGTTKTVNITIVDDPIAGPTTSASYKKNGGTSIAIVNKTATFTVDVTTKVDVTATNSAGTANESKTYTEGSAPVETFSWDNATMYFVITDRFYNGNSANDASYGRVKVDATGKNIGTFHGGDLKGLTAKLNEGYFTNLGVNSIWLTATYEQVHGFVGGGDNGDFAHYAYHGYYAMDYTNIDANMGTAAELKEFINTAHAKGIRVVMDIVMNHPGYQTIKDMAEYSFGGKKATFDPNWTTTTGPWGGYHDMLDYSGQASEWDKWWGGWVRAGLPGYTAPGGTEETKSLLFLPDFKTEDETARPLPTFLKNKADFGGAFSASLKADPTYAPVFNKNGSMKIRDWISGWLAAWVREYGFDGFRIDTAKHVERSTWALLKDKADKALKDWRAANPSDPAAKWTQDFWTTAENNPAYFGSYNSDYHGTGKFDSIINFGFMGKADQDYASLKSLWAGYAASVNADKTDKWNYLSFIDNHDTGSVYYNGSAARQIKAGTALLLTPGGVQIYYGNEYGRANGPNGSDKDQGSRSSMVWGDVTGRGSATLAHWQKLGQFRRNHLAVGGGDQADIPASSGVAFSRVRFDDKVAIVVGATGTVQVTVSSLFTDGTEVRNFYDGATGVVSGGKVSFSAGDNGVILIEKK